MTSNQCLFSFLFLLIICAIASVNSPNENHVLGFL